METLKVHLILDDRSSFRELLMLALDLIRFRQKAYMLA